MYADGTERVAPVAQHVAAARKRGDQRGAGVLAQLARRGGRACAGMDDDDGRHAREAIHRRR
jgi:hypothetical protein